jgi:hypothetical protein
MVAWAWRSVLPCATRFSIWLPFLFLAGVQAAALTVLVSFHRDAFLSIGVPLVRWVAGDAGTHYPVFYLALPTLFARVTLILSVLFASLAVGAATLLFARVFGERRQEGAWLVAARRYPALLVITAVLAVFLFAIGEGMGAIPREAMVGNRLVRWGSRAGVVFLYVLVQTLFAYGSAWILLRGRGPFRALRDSVSLAGRNFVATFLLVLAPALVLFPFSYLAGRGDWFTTKFRPETITGLLVGQIALELILGFLLVGAVTRVFLYRAEETAS